MPVGVLEGGRRWYGMMLAFCLGCVVGYQFVTDKGSSAFTNANEMSDRWSNRSRAVSLPRGPRGSKSAALWQSEDQTRAIENGKPKRSAARRLSRRQAYVDMKSLTSAGQEVLKAKANVTEAESEADSIAPFPKHSDATVFFWKTTAVCFVFLFFGLLALVVFRRRLKLKSEVRLDSSQLTEDDGEGYETDNDDPRVSNADTRRKELHKTRIRALVRSPYSPLPQDGPQASTWESFLRLLPFLVWDRYLFGAFAFPMVKGVMDGMVVEFVVIPMMAVLDNKSAADPGNSKPDPGAFWEITEGGANSQFVTKNYELMQFLINSICSMNTSNQIVRQTS